MGLHKILKRPDKHIIMPLYETGDNESLVSRIEVDEGGNRVYFYRMDGGYTPDEANEIVKAITEAAELARMDVRYPVVEK